MTIHNRIGIITGMPTPPDRYAAGERRQVWDELVALGPAAYEPRWHAEAVAVAQATMSRVSANIVTLIDRLNRMDYR